jgi:hypothetical protein
MNRSVVLAVLMAVLGYATFADAAIINGIISHASQSGGGALTTPTAYKQLAPPVQDGFTDGAFDPPWMPPVTGDSPWVWLTANASNVFEPMSVRIQLGTSGQNLFYSFRVTLTNNLPISHHPIGPVTFRMKNTLPSGALPASEFQKISFVPLSWDGNPANYPSSLTSQYRSTYNTAFEGLEQHKIHFGGLNGGGGQFLAADGPQDFYFGIHLPVLTGVVGREFLLELVPSPEPTSLVLGAFGLIGGVLLVRRRRTRKTTEEVQPQA